MADSEAPLKKPLVPNAVHLVRTAQQMNLQLSQMADQKASILMGAAFLVLVDTLARTAARIEIPLGLLTALIGAPIFVWLLARGRRVWS